MMGVSGLIEEECRMPMLLDDMDISQLMVFTQQIKKFKLMKEKKRARIESEGSDKHGQSKNPNKSSIQGYSCTLRYEKSNEYSDLLTLGVV